MSTRLVNLSLVAGSDGTRVPLVIQIFHQNTVYRITARVTVGLTWLALLEYLLSALATRLDIHLPHNKLKYFVYDMEERTALEPTTCVEDLATHQVLYLHESEFRNALNRTRRAVLVIEDGVEGAALVQLVVVEPLARLPAEFLALDFPFEERAGLVGLAEDVVEVLQDVEGDVVADLVAEAWIRWMGTAKPLVFDDGPFASRGRVVSV